MKRIIQTSKQSKELLDREKENTTCPECGNDVIFGLESFYYDGGFFNKKMRKVSTYSCLCGCRWEVDE